MTMIFLDLDGVFFDFAGHLRNLKVPPNEQWYEPRETWTPETWRREKIKVDLMHNPGFWDQLPVMDRSRELWSACQPYKPFVLTACPLPNSPQVVFDDKYKAVREQFQGDFPIHRMIVCPIGEKGKYAKPGYILVDDDAKRNGADWEAGGGTFIHHTSIDSTIEQLKEAIKNVAATQG